MSKALAILITTAALVATATTRPLPAQSPARSPRHTNGDWLVPYRDATSRLITAAFATNEGWDRLAELNDTFGPRLSGSPALTAAQKWAAERFSADGFDNVRLEPVMVPRWVRGRESLSVVQPFPRPLVMLGLGGSVATPPEGIEAEALVVSSFAELESRAADVRGKMVVYNQPFVSYGETVQSHRTSGASRAAQLGAVAALVRSVGPMGLRTPHTGALSYADLRTRIPAASITAEDAEALARMQARGNRLVLRLTMEAHAEPDAESANVVAEITGRERPDEVVVVAGHFDSWDVGGANDDGVGCIVAWEAARLIKAAGLRPRRTLRVVLYTNEENGLRGGQAYRDRHREELPRHVLMMESDSGVYPPIAIGISGPDAARDRVRDIARLFDGVGLVRVDQHGGGADIGPSVQAAGIPAASINGDPGRYFQIHHTAADTVERIDPQDISRAAAAMAVVSYLAADIPERFGEER